MSVLRLMIVLSAVSACRPENPPSQDPGADEQAIHSVLVKWYDAIHNHDSTGIAEPLTPTFLLLEDTVPMDKAALVGGLMAGRNAGSQVANLSDLKTRVHGDVAWTTMYNHEIFTPTARAPEPHDFLETVVFERIGGQWRIDRYHAARLNRGS